MNSSLRPLVLASGSATRVAMLRKAGLRIEIDPAHLNEATIKQDCRARGVAPEEAAMVLAESKALAVAQRHPSALVVGADQLLVCGEQWFDKPASPAEARAALLSLCGREHRLISGAAVAEGRTIIWRDVASARITMRHYTEQFVDWYLQNSHDDDLKSVGACRLESIGVQAFAGIDGDYFTILGFPMLSFLSFLRSRDHIVS